MRALVFWCCFLVAQTLAAQTLPEFEVTSVKPVVPNVPHTVGTVVYPGGRVILQTFSLKALIMVAFRVSFWQLSGGEPWTEKDEFDVQAKPPENANITNLRHSLFGIEDERLRQMLQALLIDRFGLKVHRETKTGDVYLLERNGKTLAMHPADVNKPGDFGSIGYVGGRWSIFATSMPQLAKFASDNVLHTPVVDRTELTGSYDYRQQQPDLEPTYPAGLDSFVRWLSESGLKLQRSKGEVEILVIDHATKPLPN